MLPIYRPITKRVKVASTLEHAKDNSFELTHETQGERVEVAMHEYREAFNKASKYPRAICIFREIITYAIESIEGFL